MIDAKIIIIFIIFNLPIIFLFNKILNIFNIYDSNDNKRKIHKTPVSLFGGTLILYNFLVIILISNIFSIDIFGEKFLNNSREIFVFIFGSVIFYLIGLFDDKYIFNSNKKFILSTLFIFILLTIDNSLIIESIRFQNFNYIDLNTFSIPFSILCLLLFLNALNMFDGINLQVSLYSTLLLVIFLIKGINLNFNLFIILSLLIFIFYNYRNKIFLGDSGSNLLFFILSYTIMKNYNLNNNFDIEEIFILMCIPGLDMFRLFLFRIMKGYNPFKADNNHIHHILLEIFKDKTLTSLVIFVTNFLIIIGYYFIQSKLLYCISVSIIYTFLIIFMKMQKSK